MPAVTGGKRKSTRAGKASRQAFRDDSAAANAPCWLCGGDIDYDAPHDDYTNGDRFQVDHYAYEAAWAPFPALQRQYRPWLNAGLQLSQIPPTAEVLLLWECDTGHRFAATPSEQRNRPGRERRRSAWCPDCTALAKPPVVRPRDAPRRPPRRAKPLCRKTPPVDVGTAFSSVCAPKPASIVEQELRAALVDRLTFTGGVNAVKVGRPFFEHVEVWPDISIPELRVAIEYDSSGRYGLEHVGKREAADRRKDRTLRAARWEVVRVRTGKLERLGQHDLQMAAVGPRGVDRIVDELRTIRGAISVDQLLR
jgi:hypothetical protein